MERDAERDEDEVKLSEMELRATRSRFTYIVAVNFSGAFLSSMLFFCFFPLPVL